MKLKRVLILGVFLAATLNLIFLPVAANAAVDVAQAKIVRVGINPGTGKGVLVRLVDESATPAWTGERQFYLSETLGNQGLATILTAYSLGKTIWVRIAGDASAASLISIVYINDTP